MASTPGVYARPHTFAGEPHILICRGHLSTMKVKLSEAIQLANSLIDIVEEEQTNGPTTMR